MANGMSCVPHSVKILRDVNRPETLAALGVWQNTSTLYLQPASSAVLSLDRVVTGLSGRCQLDAQNTRRFVLVHFTRDAERLSS